MKVLKDFLAVSIFSILIFSCENNDDTIIEKETENNNANLIEKEINGFIQKGPFITGSRITVQELSSNLVPTGIVFETYTKDDFGSFELPVKLNSNYVEVIASGFYYNEIKGQLSDAQLTLRALADIVDSNHINVNTLTTLSSGRIKYLVQDEKKSFIGASMQAKTELLKIFNIDSIEINDFHSMNISESGEENAILLAISCILQQDNSTAELSELIYKFNIDIEKDGVLSDILIRELVDNTVNLNLPTIRNNLEGKYGSNFSIPEFESFANRLIDPNYLDVEINLDSNLFFYFSPNVDNEDLSGNNNIINPINCGLTEDRNGLTNKAYSLNMSSNSYIELPSGLNLWDPGWTYALWVKIDAMGNWDEPHLLANQSFSGDFDDVYLAINSYQDSSDPSFGSIGIFVEDYFTGANASINKSKWFHCAVTYQSNIIRVYYNGYKVLNSYQNFDHVFPISSNYEISSKLRNGGRFSGAVSDIRFYKRVLSDEEVFQLFLN